MQWVLLWIALAAAALGLFVLVRVLVSGASNVAEAIGGVALLGAPAWLVLAMAPVMLRRAGEPALWYLLLSIAAALLSLWIGGSMAAYGA